MFKYLSLFRKNKDGQLDNNDVDFNEMPAPVEIEGIPGNETPVLVDNALGGQQEHPAKPTPTIDTALQEQADQTKINKIRAELSGMSDSTPSKNSFFKEGPITPEDLREPVTAFGFRLESPIPDQAGNANFSSDNETGIVTIAAQFPTDISSLLTAEQRALVDVVVTHEGTTVYYPRRQVEDIPPIVQDEQPADEGYKPPSMMDDMEPREFKEDKRDAGILRPEDLAEMIKNVPGNELVLYTGAGISKGGGEPVWDMNELKSKVQVDKGSDAFLQALLEDPEKLTEEFRKFAQQINTSNPTDAHKAIKEIMEAKSGATLMTQNGDRNHEASGVRPIHMAALPEFFEFLKGRIDKASLIVTAGLHADELSILNWMATNNPNIRIAAIDLGRSVATYPNYLTQGDYILPGDAQKTLPAVASALSP